MNDQEELKYLRKLVDREFLPSVQEGNYSHTYFCPICDENAEYLISDKYLLTHKKNCYWSKFRNVKHISNGKDREFAGEYCMVQQYKWKAIPIK